MKFKLVNEPFVGNLGIEYMKFKGIEDIENYLQPSLDVVNSPKNLENIEEGATLFLGHLYKNNKILIVVDSDVDGYTSAAILYIYAKQLNKKCPIDYILHTEKQRGVSDMMDIASEYNLVILPDSSTNDFIYHEELGLNATDVLVLDHHILDDEVKISNNAVIINNQISPKYTNKDLTGVGVVYQFLNYIDEKLNYNYAPALLDMVAIGLVGDMGDVRSLENRYFIKTGLSNIQHDFLQEVLIAQAYSMKGRVNPHTIGYYVVPLMNAMIRVGNEEEKNRLFEALITPNKIIPSKKRGEKDVPTKIALEAIRECKNAKSRQDKTKVKAIEKIEFDLERLCMKDNLLLFVLLDENDDFKPTLNGLIANDLASKYQKPTLIGREKDKLVKGSIRGVNDSELSSLRDFLLGSGLVEWVQGHDQAAGFCIAANNVDKLVEYANEQLKQYNFDESFYEVNFMFDANKHDIGAAVMELGAFEDIWGQGCQKPMMYIENLPINEGTVQILGRYNDTLKITYNGVSYMKFFAKDIIPQFLENYGKSVSLVGAPSINSYNGHSSPQVDIKDYEFTESEESYYSF